MARKQSKPALKRAPQSRKTSPSSPWPAEAPAAGPVIRAAPERWHHHSEAIDEPLVPGDRRPLQRVDTGVAQLRRAGKITSAEVCSADRWRNDYELGVHGARDPDKSGSGGGVDGYNISAIDALTRFHTAEKAVGPFGTGLLIAFVADGLSANAIAGELDQQRQAAEEAGRPTVGLWSRQDLAGAIVAALTRLTEHYEEVDSTRKGQLPPWEASRVGAERRKNYGGIWKSEVAEIDRQGWGAERRRAGGIWRADVAGVEQAEVRA